MGISSSERTMAMVLDELVDRATGADVSHAVALHARSATLRALGDGAEGAVSRQRLRRAEAYFSAVVRRRTVRGSAGPRATARFIAAAVVQDLREAGRDGSAIWRELERGWRERIPADVLEEYRLLLCG